MGGPCFEQEGEHPSAEDRELKQLDTELTAVGGQARAEMDEGVRLASYTT